MQNKGAIRLFAILMALACFFYLSFSLVTRNVEQDADEVADKYALKQGVKDSAKKWANGDVVKEKLYIDSMRNNREAQYLDSMRKIPVYNILIAQFTYEDCKEKEINLGLDLRGGINVTLEVSVVDIIKAMSNKPKDKRLETALANATTKEKTDNRDFTTIFGEELKKIDPEHPISFYFRSINYKEITAQSTDEEVLNFIRGDVTQAINTAKETLEARINRFGVSQPTIQKLAGSGRILIELPGISDKKRVRKLLQGTANLEFWETWDSPDVIKYAFEANDKLVKILDPLTAAKDSADMAEKKKIFADSLRADSIIKAENKNKPVVKLSAADSIKNALATKKKDSIRFDSLAKNAKKMTRQDSIDEYKKKQPLFAIFQANIDLKTGKSLNDFSTCVYGISQIKDTALVNKYLNFPTIKKIFPDNLKLMWANKGWDRNENYIELYAIRVNDKQGKAALSGDIISRASKTTDQKQGGSFSIEMQMKDEAAQKWKTITGDNAPKDGKPGKCIAIVLDNLVYSAPVVQGEIAGGVSSITGNFSAREADDLANILSAGKLPAPARIVEEQIVGPTLGAENIRDGFLSFGIALLVVLLFMALYYNKAGLVADVVLFVNMFFVMGVLASLGAVLTLPGIAGIVLTIGLSVDANILIFERIREELASGKGMQLAIKEGFSNAMSSIIDSNVTTLLLGLILYAYGTGPVQGFATTLIIGILTSLFCAIFISRLIFDRMLNKKRDITFGNKFTINAFKNININFVGKRKFFYLFSSAIIITGTIFYFKNDGFNLGVDFKGGRTYVEKFDKPVNTEEVIKSLKDVGVMAEVKTFGTNNTLKITTPYLIAETDTSADHKVESKINEGLKVLNNPHHNVSSSKVGETISRDIRNSSFLTIVFSRAMMFFFILIRFKKWQYGLGATAALFHDVLVVLSCYTIFDGILPFTLEINQDFIAAILTVMAYSMTDTVVVFDRLREYLSNNPKKDANAEERKGVINYALNATLSRTINTSLTIFFVLLCIFIFGGDVIRGFAFALLIGIVIGTYSSICIATPVVVDFDRKDRLVK